MSDSPVSRQPLVEVGRYERLADARQRGIVIAASDLPHWIERDGDDWILCVEAPAREIAERELAAFEREEAARPPAPAPEEPAAKVSTLSLYFAAWIISGFFLAQNLLGEAWMKRGVATSEAIIGRGEWWRTITALTLHGDLGHVTANLVTSLLFAGFLLPHLGTGWTWLAIVVSGALGNWINAWGYRGEMHGSIGASTAVFGALGLLAGAEFVARWRSPHSRSRWHLIVPLGAGLAFLAFLGVGEEGSNVDITAHLWGLVAGLPLGVALALLRVRERTPPAFQAAAVLVALLLLGGSWFWAFRAG